jgi:hypothetical protein
MAAPMASVTIAGRIIVAVATTIVARLRLARHG